MTSKPDFAFQSYGLLTYCHHLSEGNCLLFMGQLILFCEFSTLTWFAQKYSFTSTLCKKHSITVSTYHQLWREWLEGQSFFGNATCSMIGCVIVWVLPPNRTLIIPSTACQVASAPNGWTWSWDYACQVFRLSWTVEQWHSQHNVTYPLVRYYVSSLKLS